MNQLSLDGGNIMKSFLFISIAGLALLLHAGCGSTSNQKIMSEQTVTSKAQKSFPKSVIVSTHKEQRDGKSVFAVETKEGQDRRSLIYSESGILIEMIQGLQPASLPPMITKSVQAQYPDGVVFSAQKITRGKTVTFQLAVRSGTKRIEMNLDAKGKTILR